MRHDPAWPIHSYGLLTAEQANGTACACTRDEGVQHDEHVSTHLESLRNLTGNYHSGPARTDNGRGDRPPARGANPENPIAQQVQTAGSCMKGFRTPDGTRNPPPFRTLTASAKVLESGHLSVAVSWRLCADFVEKLDGLSARMLPWFLGR
jgi:hypothetical protein